MSPGLSYPAILPRIPRGSWRVPSFASPSASSNANLLYLSAKKFLVFLTMLPRDPLLYVLLASVGATGIFLTASKALDADSPNPLGKSKGALAEVLSSLHTPTEPAMAASNIFPEIWGKFACLIAFLNTELLKSVPVMVFMVFSDNSSAFIASCFSNSSATFLSNVPEVICARIP